MSVIRPHKLTLWLSRSATSTEAPKNKEMFHVVNTCPLMPLCASQISYKSMKNAEAKRTGKDNIFDLSFPSDGLRSHRAQLRGWTHTNIQRDWQGERERKIRGWRSFSLARLRAITGKVRGCTHMYTNTNIQGDRQGERAGVKTISAWKQQLLSWFGLFQCTLTLKYWTVNRVQAG